MTYTNDEQLVAKDAKGTLIAASTKPDGSIVIVLEDGRKLTFTAEQVAGIKAAAAARTKAEAEPKKGKEKTK